MTDTIKTYHADAELAELLQEAARAGLPVRVQVDGQSFEVWVGRPATALRRRDDYDPELARQALDESFGAFEGLDADAFIAEMKANRE
jgi:hypothetical protein